MFHNEIEVIDAHCHIYPDKIAMLAADNVGKFYNETAAGNGKVDALLNIGEQAGIDRFVVQSVATNPRQVASINSFIAAEVEKREGKLIGFGTLHPDSTDIPGDFRHLRELGLLGVKLHADIQKIAIDDPRCEPIYEECEQAGVPVLLHTGDSRYDFSNPNRLIPILKKYPKLTVIGAHLGGWSIWEKASEELVGFEGLYVDCSSSLGYLPAETARNVIRRYGAQRVMFGTDYPLHSPLTEMQLMEKLELEDQEYQAIFSGNVKRLLKL